MPNECIWSPLSFDIYFSMFCENHTCQSLSQNDAMYSRIFENWVYLFRPTYTQTPGYLLYSQKNTKNKILQNYFITQIR